MAVFSLSGCQFLSMIALRCVLSKKAELCSFAFFESRAWQAQQRDADIKLKAPFFLLSKKVDFTCFFLKQKEE